MEGRKRFTGLAAALGVSLLLTVPALAANHVSELVVDVTLESDGSAYVVQTWTGRFEEGTECYFPVTNLGDRTLSDLTVSDSGGAYETLAEWDVDADFAEKAGTCGLHPVDDGYEVCWGITDYGENRYAVEYRLGGLVGGYNDSDGFLFQFVPSGMNTGPTDAAVFIQTRDGSPLTAETAAVWGFGFDGEVYFSEEGGIVAYTQTPLNGGEESMILMLELPKGRLSPTRTVDGDFADVKDRAFEGSDYTPDGADEGGGGVLLFLLCAVPLAVGLLIFFGGKEGRRIKKLYKSAEYFREAPLAGNLEAAFTMAAEFQQTDDDGNLIAAVLMKLLSAGCLEPLTERDAGFMGREKETVSLRLVKAPDFRGVAARNLYALLVQAAGDDGILQERELEQYCKRSYQAMLRVVDTAKADGKDTLHGIGCYKSAMNVSGLHNLTDRGRTQLLNLMGFKKYLLDFSLIAERGVSEAVIWQDYLTFAVLLGIGDKVMQQLETLYPGETVYRRQAQTVYYTAYRYHRVTYGAAKAAETQAQRSAGGGGSSSRGGGSGFSGGGKGGGTR